nr:MAG TPA: hypothetical protein [Caudoviricetes sp.]
MCKRGCRNDSPFLGREQFPSASYFIRVGRCAVLHAGDGRRDGNHHRRVERVQHLVGTDSRVGGHGADVGLGVVLRGRGPARNHLPDGPQSVPHPVGVQQHEDRPVTPCQRLELLEGRVARGPHLAFVTDFRLADVPRIAVRRPPTHRLPPSGCGGGHSGAASGTAGRRRVERHFRGTTTVPPRR